MREVSPLDDLDDKLPHPESVEIMQEVDSMPRAWRELVYSYGFLIVSALHDEVPDVQTAKIILDQRNQQRQAQWLATDYITPTSRRGFEARY